MEEIPGRVSQGQLPVWMAVVLHEVTSKLQFFKRKNTSSWFLSYVSMLGGDLGLEELGRQVSNSPHIHILKLTQHSIADIGRILHGFLSLPRKMAKSPLMYSVVDAFTDTAFKGNPAAVCLLEEEEEEQERDEKWMQAVAMEFNISATCFVTPISSTESDNNDVSNGYSIPQFRLRWFTPVAEVKICGHGTLAAAHVLFASKLSRTNVVEFVTHSGVLVAKRVPTERNVDVSKFSDGEPEEHFSIELDFPTIPVLECESADIPSLPETLNGAPIVNISKTAGAGDIIVELSSGKTVADLQPQLDEIRKCPGRGVIVTGPAPNRSGFDFFSRFFCPKLGVNEDPVCGSAHCALVPYWSKKLGKCDLVAYMASPRGGVLDLHLDEATGRVLIRGKAVAVMEGFLLA